MPLSGPQFLWWWQCRGWGASRVPPALLPSPWQRPQGGPGTFLLFPCPGSGGGLLSWQQDTKWLKHHPSSLIYEVDDGTRKLNGDSPSHLQREAPESSNSVYTKASSSLGPRPCRRAHPAESPARGPCQDQRLSCSAQGRRRLCHLGGAIHPSRGPLRPSLGPRGEPKCSPAPGHCPASPFSGCQSIKIQLPL